MLACEVPRRGDVTPRSRGGEAGKTANGSRSPKADLQTMTPRRPFHRRKAGDNEGLSGARPRRLRLLCLFDAFNVVLRDASGQTRRPRC